MTRRAFPLPTPDRVRGMKRGRGRSAVIRRLWGQGCSLAEITAHLRVDNEVVRTTLLRPVQRA